MTVAYATADVSATGTLVDTTPQAAGTAAADGERDIVSCDAGRDRVFADSEDVLIGCELVKTS